MSKTTALGLLAGLLATLAHADEVELLTGAKLQGTVTEIRANDKEFDFEFQLGTRKVKRTYPFARVHAVTMKEKRYVLTPKSDSGGGEAVRARSAADVKRLVAAAGADPDWFATVQLDHPDTLDLSWPIKPPDKGWNNRKNMGQYIWDIINPNPSRWKPGIKLVHHCLSLHQGNPELERRDMQVLGRMYFELLQDYARAAYWLERANVTVQQPVGILLAECYWRLGSKEMAMKMLRSQSLSSQAIKLLGDMGETDQAVKMADQASRNPQSAGPVQLLAADALRRAGKTDAAIRYYEKVIANNSFRNKDYERRFKKRAQESIDALRLEDRAQVSKVADGVYQGAGGGYNGPVQVEVEVKSNRITSVKVTRHNEKQFYSAINDTTQQILQRQRVTGIDATSRATITSQAIVNGAAKALASGAR